MRATIKTHHDAAVMFPRHRARSTRRPTDIFCSHPREKNVIILSFLRETVVSNAHLKSDSIMVSDAFVMGLFDRSAAPRLRLINPVSLTSTFN